MIKSAAILLILASSVFAGWRVHYLPELKDGDYHRPERVTVTYNQNEAGFETLSDAFKSISASGKIEKLHFIRPHPFTDSDNFQNEFITALKALAPKEWEAAEKSSGNMHNPKIHLLRDYLTPAFMRTTLAKEIAQDLKPYGLVITEFGQEKLSYENHGGKRAIRGIFHIGVSTKKETEQNVVK